MLTAIHLVSPMTTVVLSSFAIPPCNHCGDGGTSLPIAVSNALKLYDNKLSVLVASKHSLFATFVSWANIVLQRSHWDAQCYRLSSSGYDAVFELGREDFIGLCRAPAPGLDFLSALSSSPSGKIGEQGQTFSSLLDALRSANVLSSLRLMPRWTLFAPTDAAMARFKKFPAAVSIMNTPSELEMLLFYHLLPLKRWSCDLAAAQRWTTADNSSLSVYVDDASSTVHVDRARVIEADIPASNGVVHVIDTVLVPPSCTPFPGAVLTT